MIKGIKEIFSWGLTIILAIILALVIRTFIFEPVMVKQTSMYPTLNDSDKVIASKISYIVSDPKFQDIAVVKIDENNDYVKRVIGLPGDTVEIKNSKVYVNGTQIYEPYISEDLVYDDYPLTTVPEGKYFVLGDNRPNSKDSRSPEVGFISRENFKSKIVFRILPLSSFGIVK